ncbi:unnamed protein product [Durusdinium trenchii]|uniref:Uncharacterized protein n=2 Tax=Durusdinium trenchii TaxID=1381693 RepID=A0ABP0SK38_9DINO
MSAYEPHPAEWNGLQGNFGIINELPGRDVRLRFKFKDMANAPVWLQSFDLLVCDLDGGSSSTEYVRAFGRHQAYWAKNTQLQLRSFGDSVEYSLNYPYRKELSSLTDLGAGNPTYAGELTPEQQRTCVSLRFGTVVTYGLWVLESWSCWHSVPCNVMVGKGRYECNAHNN